jgi:hypothetical protein
VSGSLGKRLRPTLRASPEIGVHWPCGWCLISVTRPLLRITILGSAARNEYCSSGPLEWGLVDALSRKRR